MNSDAGAQPAAPFAVTVRAKDRARVEVRSDGEVVVRGVIEPSEIRTFHATNRLVLWTANADLVEISFNGKSVPLSSSETVSKCWSSIPMGCCRGRQCNDRFARQLGCPAQHEKHRRERGAH